MKEIIILLLLVLPVAIGYECELHPDFQNRIDKDLELFSTGITPSMI